ncbi:hypothetical protein KVR01_011570 [Diaporthe batatas]|uniref:uncharacterized protein n=1 Tax=Diaporthe batatas TaxID=748121 RepID=UPI001D046951|nr:uncharacterized protein KVR01_011570 [Diaporthe batatas]KAG8158448.1 hypothetical protein KVR01_011570 [Diaporthe batatas]
MSSDSLSNQGGAADPAYTPDSLSLSSSSVQSAIPAGHTRTPVAGSPIDASLPAPPIPIPSAWLQAPLILNTSLVPTTPTALAAFFASQGLEAAAVVASLHHQAKSPATAPTVAELTARLGDARHPNALGEARFRQTRQDAPNAVALRLLAQPAAHDYGFEQSSYTNKEGNTVMGWKCKCPTCDWHSQDYTRHKDEMHVKGPTTAFYCPYHGCEQVHYGTTRFSEMKKHIAGHQTRGKGQGVQGKGRGGRG